MNNHTRMQAHSCIHAHSLAVHVCKQCCIYCRKQDIKRHKTQTWSRKKTLWHTSAAVCVWSMQIKNTRADRMLRLLCSLSGIKCSMRHAYTLLLRSTNGCTWAGTHPHRSVRVYKYDWRCIVWMRYYWQWLGGSVMTDVAVDACLSGCRWLLTRRAADLLIWGEIIQGARLQLWTNATPFQPPPPPALSSLLPIATPPPPSWEMEMGAFNVW